ncbi:histone deacetylase HDT1-like [Bidens hawaiensis]|uniref:histone deacetylase HDT1-like n=1 Tax=Bidens hawaiensis TaxID=980011 RepID=UPI004049F17E
MEYWGVEVKTGQSLDVKLGEGKILHLSQVSCGENKNYSYEQVCAFITINGKRLVLGTLHSDKMPQLKFDLAFDRDFQLSHNWQTGSVFFHGYTAKKIASRM